MFVARSETEVLGFARNIPAGDPNQNNAAKLLIFDIVTQLFNLM